MNNLNELINPEICSECGGKCCKKSGCSYSPYDFESQSFNYLHQHLENGTSSITCTFEMWENPYRITPVLSIRKRNIDRPIIDLISEKNTCVLLTETGCPLPAEQRPKAGLSLIPSSTGTCRSYYTNEMQLKEWLEHQKVLERLVKRYSGVSSETVINQQVEIATEYMTRKLLENGGNTKNFSQAAQELLEMLARLQNYSYGEAIERGRKRVPR